MRSIYDEEWVQHYNHGRPHMSLGPGIPFEAKESIIHVAEAKGRHHWPDGCALRVRPILGGLHHEYQLEKIAA